MSRGRFTLTPSISILGEYNDNLFLTARDETEDFILGIVPGFTLAVQGPRGRLLAGYNFTAEFYAEETGQNDVGKRQQLFADALYRIGPTVTFTLLERFIYDRESSVVTTGSISTGREESMRNTLAPRLEWQATPRTSLNISGSHTLLRFDGDAGSDSDTYRVAVGAGHSFTPRLTGTAALDVGYLDIEDEESATTYTPTLGLSYQFTPTVRGAVSAGPSVFVRDGETTLTPAAGVSLDRLFRIGSLRIGYNRAVVAESIGSTDRQTAYASLRLPTLTRRFGIELTPRYTRADRDIEGDEVGADDRVEVITVNLRATYQIARTISIFGAYTFFHQRTETGMDDVDQNRVFFGFQYSYPINLD